MYHEIRTPNVNDTDLRRDLSCSPQQFIQHLNWIERQGYVTITSGQLLRIPCPKRPIMLTFDDGRESCYFAASELLRHGMRGVFYVNTAAMGKANHLTRLQIIDMSRMGMEIGSHTVSHTDLRNLSMKQLLFELSHSKKVLQELTGQPINSLAYPSGGYDQKVIKAVKHLGYFSARTTGSGCFLGLDPFRIPVIRVHPSTTPQNLARMIKNGL